MLAEREPKPWERQPGETVSAYQAAQIYFNLGPGRSLSDASVKYYDGKPADKRRRKHSARTASKRRAGGDIYKWAVEHHWAERAAAIDAERGRLDKEARDRADRAERDTWARSFVQSRKDFWEIAQTLKVRAVEMLAHPIAQTSSTTVSEDGKHTTTTVTEPAKWLAKDIPLFLKAAAEIEDIVMRSFLPVTDQPPPAPAPGEPPDAAPRPRTLNVNLTHHAPAPEPPDPGP